MAEIPPGKKKPDTYAPKQGILFYTPEITSADYATFRLPKNISGEQVRPTISIANAEAVRTEKLHWQLREICNQSHTKFIRQFISWIIDLPVPERLKWLQWIIANTSRVKRKSKIFIKFTEQVKKGFSLVNPDLKALFILFAEYNKSKDYNQEIQTALQKYLDQYDRDNKIKKPNPK